MFGKSLGYTPPWRPPHFWRDEANQWHEFTVFSADEIWAIDGAIVYIMARVRLDGCYDALYIGETDYGYDRLSRHEKLAAARARGLTHFHVRFVADRSQRLDLETELRHVNSPPLNEQDSPPDLLGGLAALSRSSASLLGAPIEASEYMTPYTEPFGGFGLAALSALNDPPAYINPSPKPVGGLGMAGFGLGGSVLDALDGRSELERLIAALGAITPYRK